MSALRLVAGVLAVYHLVVASRVLTWLGIFVPPVQHRAISLTGAILLVYAGRKALASAAPGRLRRGVDFLLLALGLASIAYPAVVPDAMLFYGQYGYLDAAGMALALAAGLVVLEATRRTTGAVLPVIVVFFIVITVYQGYLPGILHGKGYPLDRLTYSTYASSSGMFGTPLGVASTILITFIVLGALLEASGAGRWFVRLTMWAAGWTIGGSAKVAVLASALFGMISGSPSANVATVGVVTIPLMTGSGYPPRLAAAVEATASTGGQFMPPVMGAVAFIMAEALAMPYSQIAIMAAIPAVLYFSVVFVSVHLEASKLGLPALPREQLPGLGEVVREGWFYVIPLAALMYWLLVRGYPPEMAGLLSALTLVPVSFLAGDQKGHLTPSRIWNALVDSVRSWVPIAIVTGAVGILVGALELSGLGVKFSGFILDLSAGNLPATLALVGLASFVLGLGLDSIPAYLTLIVLAAPALTALGVPIEVAHLFVLYWGLSSFITPPTCIAVYVACAISKSDMWETGWEAVRLGIAAYLVPFAFVYHPALLGRGSWAAIAGTTILALLASAALAVALRGHADRPVSLGARVVLASGAVMMIAPSLWATATGAALIAVGAVLIRFSPAAHPRFSRSAGFGRP